MEALLSDQFGTTPFRKSGMNAERQGSMNELFPYRKKYIFISVGMAVKSTVCREILSSGLLILEFL